MLAFMSEPETIAERIIYVVDKDSRGFDVGIMIGKPYQTDSKYGEWGCPIALIGLHGRLHDVYGVDSWQALTLAIRLVRDLLDHFVESGGKLYSPEHDNEISVAELFGDVSEQPVPDEPPSEEQQERINKLTDEDIRIIDGAILASSSTHWRKVARVVGDTMNATSGEIPNVPDIYYSERIRKLAAAGKLESQGNLYYMRFSEIRLPS